VVHFLFPVIGHRIGLGFRRCWIISRDGQTLGTPCTAKKKKRKGKRKHCILTQLHLQAWRYLLFAPPLALLGRALDLHFLSALVLSIGADAHPNFGMKEVNI
jgi:hypothetical protein